MQMDRPVHCPRPWVPFGRISQIGKALLVFDVGFGEALSRDVCVKGIFDPVVQSSLSFFTKH